ncbi:MAG TPA: hypothetical protein VFA94_14840 [Acidimicrobiales bacterium]|nr:hypothetical protein [Acidimicrobiales bacterium]
MPDLDIAGIVRTLNAHGVRYVVIGGVAALAHDLPVPATVDIDITPKRESANLRRLADAFDDLEASLLTADQSGTWFPHRPVENWASYDTLHLITRLGALDVVFAPDGAPRGYEDLVGAADRRPVLADDAEALVVSVASWEHLKLAAGRAKDLAHLDQYYEERDSR